MRRTFSIIWFVLTLRCEEADRVRCLKAEGAASRHEILAEALHSALCKSCRAARKQVRQLDEALGELRDRVGETTGIGGVAMSEGGKARLRELARERHDPGESPKKP